MDLVKRSLSTWIQAAIILTVGILCIIAGASKDVQTSQQAADTISIILGIVLIIVGSLSIALAVVVGILAKKGFAAIAIPGGFALAIGISLLASHYAAGLIGLLIYIVPFILIVLGAVILADGVYQIVKGSLAKNLKGSLIPAIILIVIGTIGIVLGALCIGNDPIIGKDIQLIIFGIIVCLVAALMVLFTFVRLPDAVVTVVKVEEDK